MERSSASWNRGFVVGADSAGCSEIGLAFQLPFQLGQQPPAAAPLSAQEAWSNHSFAHGQNYAQYGQVKFA